MIISISSLKHFLKKCKKFINWVNKEAKIIFLINSGDRGIYETSIELEKSCSKDNIAHGRDITTSAAISKVRVVLGKVSTLTLLKLANWGLELRCEENYPRTEL